MLKGVARLSTAAFLLQACSMRFWRGRTKVVDVPGRGVIGKSVKNNTQCLMCGRRGMDFFRCSGHSVQPVA